ncbi:Mitogen-activated protein kinase kinase kinase [Trema orientale]|uniref:Mitogen-activated protein kinase kinase kinase n=1 Tax=Trema orientale TaxID=63057 RepID=A0A2P5DRV7_TREOI|nr:Mitogen-activated protein kinase kinase kinase [Trema orientale]
MSNPRVTITLGRTGQVVERGGTGSEFSHGYTRDIVSGSKRSMEERLGTGSNGVLSSANKRQRGDGSKWSSADNTHDYQLTRNDLRLKLMRKRQPKQIQGGMELQMKRPNMVQTPLNHHMPQYKSEMNGNTHLRKIPPRESADDLLLVDSLRNSYSSRNTHELRGRSPDRTSRNSLRLSPPRNFEELWKVPPIWAADASRVGQFPSSSVVTASQPTGSMPMTMKATPGTAKLVSQFAPGSSSMQHIPHMEHLNVVGLLRTLGLEKYAILFQAEEVDMTALRQMGDKDLKDLGLPMGPRKKILLALVPARPKRPPP